jgi:predicted O-linked N-acetylglucosamine transferase (SPINDLY family)
MHRKNKVLKYNYIKTISESNKIIKELKFKAKLLQNDGNYTEAAVIYNKVLTLDDTDLVALNDLGSIYRRLSKFELALSTYDKALKYHPEIIEIKFNKANLLNEMGFYIQAIKLYEEIVIINPSFSDAFLGLAISQNSCGNYNDSLLNFKKSLSLDSHNLIKTSAYLFKLSHTENISPEFIKNEHLLFNELAKKNNIQNNFLFKSTSIIKIGIISADLHHHAITSFIEDILINLQYFSNIKLTIFYNSNINDKVNARLRSYLHNWFDIYQLNDEEVASLIIECKIDALFDLSGHTKGNRLSVFSTRVAPVQITWMGYPGTTGLKNMDYIIADKFYIPNKFTWQFSEKIIWLPISATYKNNFSLPNLTQAPCIRNKIFTFGSFNRINKITKACVKVWSQILKLTNSVFIIGGMPSDSANIYIKDWFIDEGVDLARISFHPSLAIDDYFKLISTVDLCLDTFPYTGGTTTWHSAIMGVPTLSIYGETAAQCVSSTILYNLKLDIFVSENTQSYIEKAISFSKDYLLINSIRLSMRSRYHSSLASKPKLFTSALILSIIKSLHNYSSNTFSNIEVSISDARNYSKSNSLFNLGFKCFLNNDINRALYYINKSLFYKADFYPSKKTLGSIFILQQKYSEGALILESINDYSDIELIKNLIIAYEYLKLEIRLSELISKSIAHNLIDENIINYYIEFLLPENFQLAHVQILINLNYFTYNDLNRLIEHLYNFGSENRFEIILNICALAESKFKFEDELLILKNDCIIKSNFELITEDFIKSCNFNSHVLNILLGDIHKTNNNYLTASYYYTLALESNHQSTAGINKFICNQIYCDNLATALSNCYSFNNTKNITTLICLSNLCLEFSNYNLALNYLLSALKISKSSSLYFEIANILFLMNDIDKSFDYCNNSLILNKYNLNSLKLLSALYKIMEDEHQIIQVNNKIKTLCHPLPNL